MVRRFEDIIPGVMAAGALTSLICAGFYWRDLSPRIDETTIENMPNNRSDVYYSSLHDAAVRQGDWELSRLAATKESQRSPNKAAAWNRLVFSETEIAGEPNAAALMALLSGYENAPYPAPADMRWRVEYAARYWAFMPDIVQEKTRTQIKTLEQMPQTWRVREKWCQSFPPGALKEDACNSLKTE